MEFFWSVLSRIWTEYGDLLSKYPYSVQIRENKDQKKLRIWTLFQSPQVILKKSKLKTGRNSLAVEVNSLSSVKFIFSFLI